MFVKTENEKIRLHEESNFEFRSTLHQNKNVQMPSKMDELKKSGIEIAQEISEQFRKAINIIRCS